MPGTIVNPGDIQFFKQMSMIIFLLSSSLCLMGERDTKQVNGGNHSNQSEVPGSKQRGNHDREKMVTHTGHGRAF